MNSWNWQAGAGGRGSLLLRNRIGPAELAGLGPNASLKRFLFLNEHRFIIEEVLPQSFARDNVNSEAAMLRRRSGTIMHE